MRVTILILSLLLFSLCTKAQENKEKDNTETPSHQLIIAGDNGITGLCTTALGTFIVISKFPSLSPRSADAIKAAGYSCIAVGVFFSAKSFYHLRKAGKLITYNKQEVQNQQGLNLALSPAGFTINWRF
ncbi:MAG: hypothetical protein Q8880_05705 [Bacteroidota bacterium]|nr:hypothetical protein [Bacteroidota bacterium]